MTIMSVDLHLPWAIPVESTTEWFHALSIPRRDIERLATRPLKWLRFATFTVCGAKGHLSATQGGQTVDYENVSFDDLGDRYYYTPDNDHHFVDYEAFNDKCTTTAATPRSYNFRERVCTRDDKCVITSADRDDCDAAHIIPRSKGSEITSIVHNRSSLYERLPFSLGEDVDINCIENGILLRADLHKKFGKAKIVFLRTPNFAMVPDDVPRVEQGSMPDNRTTLQYMVEPPSTECGPVLQWDVQADWHDEISPPPSILLDFMYGAAVVQHWKCARLREMLEEEFEDTFQPVLDNTLERSAPEDDKFGEPDDPKVPNWEPASGEGKGKGRKTFSSDASAGLLQAMDDVLFLGRLLKRTTPRSIAAERERRCEEEELRSQAQSRDKVQQWLDLSGQSQVTL